MLAHGWCDNGEDNGEDSNNEAITRLRMTVRNSREVRGSPSQEEQVIKGKLRKSMQVKESGDARSPRQSHGLVGTLL